MTTHPTPQAMTEAIRRVTNELALYSAEEHSPSFHEDLTLIVAAARAHLSAMQGNALASAGGWREMREIVEAVAAWNGGPVVMLTYKAREFCKRYPRQSGEEQHDKNCAVHGWGVTLPAPPCDCRASGEEHHSEQSSPLIVPTVGTHAVPLHDAPSPQGDAGEQQVASTLQGRDGE
jgi:hypothetical protein